MPFHDTAVEASEKMREETKINPDIWVTTQKALDGSNAYNIRIADAAMLTKMLAVQNVINAAAMALDLLRNQCSVSQTHKEKMDKTIYILEDVLSKL